MLVEPTIVKQGSNYHVKHGDDSGLFVEFSMEPVLNEERSQKEGRPIFEDKEYITIRIMGDTKTVRKRPVKTDWSGNSPPDTERWPNQYRAFKNQQVQVSEGTPILEWGMITRSEAMSLKAINIHTVDALASLGDNNIQWFGGRQLRDKAKAWIEHTKDNSGIAKLQAENDQLRADVEALKNQIKALDKPKRKKAEE